MNEKNTSEPDVRWKQRFNNYMRAFQALTRGIELAKQRPLTELEEQGLIQGFEFTHELSWKCLKDYMEYQGAQTFVGSRDTTRRAFRTDLISDGEVWMDMIKARNLTSHTYEQEVARLVIHDIVQRFYPAFKALTATFTALCEQDDAQ
jgi:nucleotidyltransferase substrate binding protein (TIGR01987 family)